MNIINDKSCIWINDLTNQTNIKSIQSNEDCDWLIKCVTIRTMEETKVVIKKSCDIQNKEITKFIEVTLNQELGIPFRRNAMKKPVKVAVINKADMIKQPSFDG